jgi:hypothetical protein
MKTLQGKLFGTVPYDFRPPTLQRARDTWWNPNDDAIVKAQAFGVGWTLNLAALKKRYPVAFWALVAFVGLRIARRIRRLAS